MKITYASIAAHPVTVAIAPQKEEAIARAEKEALAKIESVKADLAANNNDLNACAPYPSSQRDSGFVYHAKLAKHRTYSSLTSGRKGNDHSFGKPYYVDMSEKGCAKYVEQRKEDAATQYESFAIKLVGKIGECVSATLSGSHVWGYSFLTVVKGTGLESTKEVWKTQQIVNVSKLGLPFNQWPSRKMK